MQEYRERDALLLRLGFRTYSHYLSSDLWKWIRRRVLDANNGCCMRCGRPAVNVHHTQYTLAVLTGESIASLVPLCSDCHRSGELTPEGFKVTLPQANERLGLVITPPDETLPQRRQRLIPNVCTGRAVKANAREQRREARKGKKGFCRRCGGHLNKDHRCVSCGHYHT